MKNIVFVVLGFLVYNLSYAQRIDCLDYVLRVEVNGVVKSNETNNLKVTIYRSDKTTEVLSEIISNVTTSVAGVCNFKITSVAMLDSIVKSDFTYTVGFMWGSDPVNGGEKHTLIHSSFSQLSSNTTYCDTLRSSLSDTIRITESVDLGGNDISGNRKILCDSLQVGKRLSPPNLQRSAMTAIVSGDKESNQGNVVYQTETDGLESKGLYVLIDSQWKYIYKSEGNIQEASFVNKSYTFEFTSDQERYIEFEGSGFHISDELTNIGTYTIIEKLITPTKVKLKIKAPSTPDQREVVFNYHTNWNNHKIIFKPQN